MKKKTPKAKAKSTSKSVTTKSNKSTIIPKGTRIKMSWEKFDIVIQHMRRVYIWGQPGIGKSYVAQAAARSISNQEPFQVTLNEDQVAQELLGHYVPEGDKFVWHDGPVASAMRHGVPLIINEIARASGAVQDMLLSVLDDPSVASIALPNRERLKPKEGFRVFATANTSPDELDEALRDRFDAVIKVNEPHPNLTKTLNTKLSQLGDFISDSYKDPKRAISPRKAFAFLQLFEGTTNSDISAEIVFGKGGGDFLSAARSRGIEV